MSLATFYRHRAAIVTPWLREHLEWIYAETPVTDPDADRLLRGAAFVCEMFAPVQVRPVGRVSAIDATRMRARLRALLALPLRLEDPSWQETILSGSLVARPMRDARGPVLFFEWEVPAVDVVRLALLLLLAVVPPSLVRPCTASGCGRVFLGAKNQKYCGRHQRQARRQTQRAAERAFRQRAKQTKTRATTKRRRR